MADKLKLSNTCLDKRERTLVCFNICPCVHIMLILFCWLILQFLFFILTNFFSFKNLGLFSFLQIWKKKINSGKSFCFEAFVILILYNIIQGTSLFSLSCQFDVIINRNTRFQLLFFSTTKIRYLSQIPQKERCADTFISITF